LHNNFQASQNAIRFSERRCRRTLEPKIAWRQLLKDAKLTNLRMHDLRRTMGSYMAMSNQSLPIIGKALGHKSHTSTQIYARLDLDPVRLAMEQAQAQMQLAATLPDDDEDDNDDNEEDEE
jgi:integrase